MFSIITRRMFPPYRWPRQDRLVAPIMGIYAMLSNYMYLVNEWSRPSELH